MNRTEMIHACEQIRNTTLRTPANDPNYWRHSRAFWYATRALIGLGAHVPFDCDQRIKFVEEYLQP